MKNSYKFINNTDCKYFPCHKTSKPEEFNCLFCYCPLYFLGDRCGGNFKYLNNMIKDCSDCLVPHVPKNYDMVTSKLFTEILSKANRGDQ